ncbi:MAG: hypothetical protein J07HX64_00718 [halophilic archaeon J07HX64]|jgi:Uncharacterized membrane-associated protein/domain|nr:MAG: hypothetical protein J07HX64_00718 [halophilic archaeon J07HX64]
MSVVGLWSVLSRGPPPWARDAGESNQRLQALVLGLGVAVLILFVLVAILWRRRSRVEQSSPEDPDDVAAQEAGGITTEGTGGIAAAEPSEYEQIRRIDSTVEGRLPQQEIVKQTDWSEAKVSRVVSRLADEGELKKVRVGRRNLIQLSNDEENEPTEPGIRDSASS